MMHPATLEEVAAASVACLGPALTEDGPRPSGIPMGARYLPRIGRLGVPAQWMSHAPARGVEPEVLGR